MIDVVEGSRSPARSVWVAQVLRGNVHIVPGLPRSEATGETIPVARMRFKEEGGSVEVQTDGWQQWKRHIIATSIDLL